MKFQKGADRSTKLRQIETLDELSYAAYQASKKAKEKNQKKTDKRSRNGSRNERKASNKKSKIECSYCNRLGHSSKRNQWQVQTKRKKEASETVNAMTTFEFSNLGVDRNYSGTEASDTSVNTQFEAMELEEDQVRKQ